MLIAFKKDLFIILVKNFKKKYLASSLAFTTMGVARSIQADDLDQRMTDETKKFVTSYLSYIDPKLLMTTDVNVVRMIKGANAELINNQLKFEKLQDEKEYFADSLFDDFKIPLTAYVPKEFDPGSPIVVFFHGGGGCFGTRQTYRHPVGVLAEMTGCIWLSVEYRLAPEYKIPTGHNDCLSVVSWVIDNKSSVFNCNQCSKIGVCGDSFGGTVAAYISNELKSKISFQILINAFVAIADLGTESENEFTDDQYILIHDVCRFFASMMLKNEQDTSDLRVSPLDYPDFTKLPRTLLIAAELDLLRDQSKVYHEKLLTNNIDSELKIIKGVVHGYFSIPSIIPKGFSEAAELIVSFLASV